MHTYANHTTSAPHYIPLHFTDAQHHCTTYANAQKEPLQQRMLCINFLPVPDKSVCASTPLFRLQVSHRFCCNSMH